MDEKVFKIMKNNKILNNLDMEQLAAEGSGRLVRKAGFTLGAR